MTSTVPPQSTQTATSWFGTTRHTRDRCSRPRYCCPQISQRVPLALIHLTRHASWNHEASPQAHRLCTSSSHKQILQRIPSSMTQAPSLFRLCPRFLFFRPHLLFRFPLESISNGQRVHGQLSLGSRLRSIAEAQPCEERC